jgi:uncharacterized phage protein (TIGR01671 family)
MRGFRVWSNFWKRYAFDAELHMDGSVDAIFEDDDGVPHHENTDLVLEFDTDLKDKNGKEIYWGDILGGIWESGFISWCEKCKQFQYHSAGIGCMACSGDVHWCEIVEDDGKLEVIGNIHENHELLEEQ